MGRFVRGVAADVEEDEVVVLQSFGDPRGGDEYGIVLGSDRVRGVQVGAGQDRQGEECENGGGWKLNHGWGSLDLIGSEGESRIDGCSAACRHE